MSSVSDPANLELARAGACHDRNDRQGAMRGYRRAAALDPGRIEAAGSVGLLAGELGDHFASHWLRRALALDPESTAALHNLALVQRNEDADESTRALRRLLVLLPGHPEGNRLLAKAAADRGNLSTSHARLTRVLAVDLHSAPAWIARGEVLGKLSCPIAAGISYRKAVSLAPALIGALNAAGALAIDSDRDDEAAILFRRGLAIDPVHPALLANLGRSLLRLGRSRDAVLCLRRSCARAPSSSETFSSLGFAETFLDNERSAINFCHRATTLAPLAALPRVIDAAIKRGAGELTIAAHECRIALACDPALADGHMVMGTAYQEMGVLRSALAHYRHALAVRRIYVDAERNLLYALLHLPEASESEVFEAAVAFARRHKPPPTDRLRPPLRNQNPERRLKVGYISSDFRDHPNRWFLNAVFTHRDRNELSVTCYHAHRRHDRETEWISDRVDGWREVNGMPDAALATLIREDSIDIAVYLGGRFDGNRPLVAAYRPAPVQVSYLDGGTSGISEMDYWITDGFLHPETTNEERFTEQLYRLPAFYSFTRPMPDLPVGSPPALSRQGITFGSFAQPSRVTDEVIAVWAQVLAAVPLSRLLLKSRNRYGDAGNRDRLLGGFATRGIDPARIAIESAHDSHLNHLSRYNRVDVALDTFPFSGATTTFEALWMGVPAITLPGSRFVARMAGAILTAGGHPELIAASKDEYISIAVSLACDLSRLASLRRALRRDLSASPLCDGPAYARSIERAYRAMWRKWCSGAS